MVGPILWFALVGGDGAVASPRPALMISECGAALDDTAAEANAIGAATIKARQFSRRSSCRKSLTIILVKQNLRPARRP